MRKWLWLGCCVALCAAVGFYLAAVYVRQHPDSTFARIMVGVYRAGTTANPVVHFTHETAQRVASAVRHEVAPREAVAAKPAQACPASPQEVAELRKACEQLVKTELPPAELLGTVTVPKDSDPSEPLPAPFDGGEEAAEFTPMGPLDAEPAAPAVMPYLTGEIPYRLGRLLETNVEDAGGTEESEPPTARPDETFDQVYPNPCSSDFHPHPGCTQPMVCPYSGKCYPADEDNKPVEPPAEEETPQAEPMYHHYHDYHHEVVCPYTGKSYPVEEPTPTPMKTEPELKAEEQQEPPAKPEKKQEIKKKRRVRHKLYLLEGDPAEHQKEKGDTLEFRPSDANPNEFGLIPF